MFTNETFHDEIIVKFIIEILLHFSHVFKHSFILLWWLQVTIYYSPIMLSKFIVQ